MNRFSAKAETALSLLVAITLLSVLILVFNRWQTEQNRQLNHYFQRQQAVQILENQIALKLAGQDCETSITQNQIRFEISCSGSRKIVRFPLGEVELNND